MADEYIIKGDPDTAPTIPTGNVDLESDVTGVLPIANGGTGDTDGDSKDLKVTFTSADDDSIFNSGNLAGQSAYVWNAVSTMASAEKHSSLFNKISTMFKNIRTIAKLLGTTDISSIGDGTVSGAINALNVSLSTISNKVSAKLECASSYKNLGSVTGGVQYDIGVSSLVPSGSTIKAILVNYCHYGSGVTDWNVKYITSGSTISIVPQITSSNYIVEYKVFYIKS